MEATDIEATDIEGVIAIKETAHAILIRRPTGAKHWIPKSLVHEDSEVWRDGDYGRLVVATWFVEREGIE